MKEQAKRWWKSKSTPKFKNKLSSFSLNSII